VALRPPRKTLSRRLLEHKLKGVLSSLPLKPCPEADLLCVDLGGVGRYRAWLPNSRLLTIDLDSQHRPQIVSRAEAIPLSSASVDLVLSTEMLEHCPEPARVAGEVHRVLRPGGILVLTTPFVYVVHGWPQDYYRFTASGLENLFRGFSKVETLPFGNRLMVAYDLVVGFTPILSSWLNPGLALLFRNATSRTCPAGHLLIATK